MAKYLDEWQDTERDALLSLMDPKKKDEDVPATVTAGASQPGGGSRSAWGSTTMPPSVSKGLSTRSPPPILRQRIEIRHPVHDPEELYLYDNGLRVGKIKLLDTQENARTFRPQQASTHLSFHKGEVLP